MEILMSSVGILILLSLPLLIGNTFAFILKFFIKNEKFLRILKYFVFATVFVLEFLMIQTYMRRAIRARIRTVDDSEVYRVPQRIEQLNKLKDEGRIGDAVYNEALKNTKE